MHTPRRLLAGLAALVGMSLSAQDYNIQPLRFENNSAQQIVGKDVTRVELQAKGIPAIKGIISEKNGKRIATYNSDKKIDPKEYKYCVAYNDKNTQVASFPLSTTTTQNKQAVPALEQVVAVAALPPMAALPQHSMTMKGLNKAYLLPTAIAALPQTAQFTPAPQTAVVAEKNNQESYGLGIGLATDSLVGMQPQVTYQQTLASGKTRILANLTTSSTVRSTNYHNRFGEAPGPVVAGQTTQFYSTADVKTQVENKFGLSVGVARKVAKKSYLGIEAGFKQASARTNGTLGEFLVTTNGPTPGKVLNSNSTGFSGEQKLNIKTAGLFYSHDFSKNLTLNLSAGYTWTNDKVPFAATNGVIIQPDVYGKRNGTYAGVSFVMRLPK